MSKINKTVSYVLFINNCLYIITLYLSSEEEYLTISIKYCNINTLYGEIIRLAESSEIFSFYV